MKKLVLVVGLMMSHIVSAGSGGGKIQMIMAHSDDIVIFQTETNTNKATCSTAGEGSQWAISLQSKTGEAMYSLLLTAQSQGKSIGVHGTGDCSAWGDREAAHYIFFYN